MPRIVKASASDIELNRWCIEMAMAWPTIHVPAVQGNYAQAAPGYSSLAGQGGLAGHSPPMPERDIDADVIARASKIRDWIKGT